MTAAEAGLLAHAGGIQFACTVCGRTYPPGKVHHHCPDCGGVFDFAGPLKYVPPQDTIGGRRGLERFRGTFPVPEQATWVGLGEGGTPLVPIEVGNRLAYLKCEHLNPTGSFKDRGTAVLVSWLASLGVREALEDSSGNAGASFAAYAARAGIHARVFVPAYASGPKRRQIEAYGAELVAVPGERTEATRVAIEAAGRGGVYASHAYLPHGLAGMATLAYEIVEQLGGAPGTVIAPIGQGTLFLGAFRGFMALRDAGLISDLPRMVGMQAEACAPVWRAIRGLAPKPAGETLAEGIRIAWPLRRSAIVGAVEATHGDVLAVTEGQIEEGMRALSGRGFFVEPTSATVWQALVSPGSEWPDPIVAVLTGSGMKDPWV